MISSNQAFQSVNGFQITSGRSSTVAKASKAKKSSITSSKTKKPTAGTSSKPQSTEMDKVEWKSKATGKVQERLVPVFRRTEPSVRPKGTINFDISPEVKPALMPIRTAPVSAATRMAAANKAGVLKNNNGEPSASRNPRVKSAIVSGTKSRTPVPPKTATQYFQERNIPHVPRGVAGISIARMAANMGRDIAKNNATIVRAPYPFLRKSMPHYENPEAVMKARAILKSSMNVPVHVPGPRYDNIYIGPYTSDSREELLYRSAGVIENTENTGTSGSSSNDKKSKKNA